MQSEKEEGQSKSEIIVIDFDWPSGFLNRDHLLGHATGGRQLETAMTPCLSFPEAARFCPYLF